MVDRLPFRIILAQPRGFCAGVERAIEIVERALVKFGAPVYVRHEIVHNKHVVEDLKAKGVIFVGELTEVPDGAITVFSAHGVSQKVESEARLRDLPLIDATCPLVTKVHKEAQRYETEGREIILIGHAGHPEVEGTSGRVKDGVRLVQTAEDVANLNVRDEGKLAYVTQTTLSVDDTRDIIAALKKRFPAIVGPGERDICYATQNRQNAVRELAKQTDLILVLGSQKSSNSNRLRDLGLQEGVQAYLINDASEIDEAWLSGKRSVGITAGASAPEKLVQEVVHYLKRLHPAAETLPLEGIQENVKFKLPEQVANLPPAA
ncbi:MAG: 4-hydroxy-3-methylbut-2-enyl diphosphate reductase [Alphaproteobacteria bacterium]|nr:4-hydroxy-3-methylbut-2-enyl diphosphate reductase [Alphaproteobacteria bacterium]